MAATTRRTLSRPGDAGISLLEVLVSVMLIGVLMTALTSFFVTSVSATGRQGGQQIAVQLADDAIERARALKGSALALGRDKASSDAQWASPVAGVAPYLAGMAETWDPAATYPSGASAALPTSPRTVTVDGIPFAQHWYLGKCWQPLAGGDCGATSASGHVELFRVVVALIWSERHCAASTCSYVTSTLVSNAASEPVFNPGQSAQAPRVLNPGNQTGEVSVPELLQVAATGGAPPLTWSGSGLPDGLSITSNGLISGSPTAACTCSVTVRATDGFGLVGSAAFTWNGTAFASATEVLLPATGTTSWSASFAAASFPADGAYTVRAVATDTAGNKASTSRSFTIDRTAPAPVALTLFDADGEVTPRTDQVRVTFSEAINTSSICSAWSGTGDQTLGGNGVVVTITNNGSNDILTVTSNSCTLNIGSIATGNDYVSATARFSGPGNNQSRVTWKASSRLLTISIGRQTSGTLNSGLSAATAVYTPDAAIRDAAGNAISTTPFSSAGQRF